jgi:hypothetical protein
MIPNTNKPHASDPSIPNFDIDLNWDAIQNRMDKTQRNKKYGYLTLAVLSVLLIAFLYWTDTKQIQKNNPLPEAPTVQDKPAERV